MLCLVSRIRGFTSNSFSMAERNLTQCKSHTMCVHISVNIRKNHWCYDSIRLVSELRQFDSTRFEGNSNDSIRFDSKKKSVIRFDSIRSLKRPIRTSLVTWSSFVPAGIHFSAYFLYLTCIIGRQDIGDRGACPRLKRAHGVLRNWRLSPNSMTRSQTGQRARGAVMRGIRVGTIVRECRWLQHFQSDTVAYPERPFGGGGYITLLAYLQAECGANCLPRRPFGGEGLTPNPPSTH